VLLIALAVVATVATAAVVVASYALVLYPLRASLKRNAANASYPPADGKRMKG
jgi:hypothetical protein